jgi:LmbE family N-acetylglucosaminyl deacetylase
MNFARFDSSALVVAHPDDEALWFSSIVGKVSRVIIAYEECDDLPGLGQSRRAASNAYPIQSATFLRRAEPCSLSYVDWSKPRRTRYGMALNRSKAEQRYRKAYRLLRRDLSTLLAGTSDVFTHNPWGEYGHPDHVQISRVVSDLSRKLGFRVHFSSYIAPRSMQLAARFIPALTNEGTLKTSRAWAARIKTVYVDHGCWTWHRDYVPPQTEAFLTKAGTQPTEADVLTLNCLMTT